MTSLFQNVRRFQYRYGLVGLLWTALFLEGMKMPVTFFVWGMLALVFVGFQVQTIAEDLSVSNYWKEFALAFWIVLSQGFAKDPSVTFYYSTQAFLFLFLWVSIKSDPKLLPPMPTLMAHLTAMGIVSLIVTVFQIAHHQWQNAYGLFPINPIFNSSWIAAIAVALTTFLLHPTPSEKKTPYRLGASWTIAGVFILFCLILPARSSVLALIAGLLYASYRYITMRHIMVMLSIILLGTILTPSHLLSRRLRLNEGNYRNSLWTVAWQAATDHPWVGRGMGNFEMGYQRHAFAVETTPARYTHTTGFAHNEFLQMAADMGFPACLLLSVGILGLILTPLSIHRQTQITSKAALVVLAVLASYNIIWHLPILIFLTILLSQVLLTPTGLEDHSRRRTPGVYKIYTMVIGMAVIAVSLGGYAIRDLLDRQGRWATIIRYAPFDASAWNEWANQQSDLDQALKGYWHSTTLVPEQPYFHESYASILEATHQDQNLDLALREYETALREAPSRAIDALAIGRILFIRNKPQEALQWFNQARHIEPQYWECDLWSARCLARMGRFQAAVAMLDHLKTRRDDYFRWLSRVVDDLPEHKETSPYQQTILAYDENVRRSEKEKLIGHVNP